MNVSYQIDDEVITLELDGDVMTGNNEVLLAQDTDLMANTDWREKGYTVVPFLKQEDFDKVKAGITQKIADVIRSCGGKIDDDFTLARYHLYVDDAMHLEIAKAIKDGWLVAEFPIDFQIVNDRMSDLLHEKVCTELKGSQYNSFFLRIVRPKKYTDNNPPHRDVWLDRLRHAVNIYAPLSGSNKGSALPILPGSHLLMESQIERTAAGARLNGTQYTVPCVTSVLGSRPHMIRPDLVENEMMIFTPYMVHGGGYNLNESETRTSLEVRFWKV
ncbi:MAG: hypothetical protein JST83_14385 [Bacteroidetes bacterium]|nr:hypothetical protein [Bacteroidota bacterium]